jgi:hypothetical protein
MTSPCTITPQDWARRLIRSRNWHLYQAGAARNQLARWVAEAAGHEAQAQALKDEIEALGFQPQPPMGPRDAA